MPTNLPPPLLDDSLDAAESGSGHKRWLTPRSICKPEVTGSIQARSTSLHASGEEELALDLAPRHESQPASQTERSLVLRMDQQRCDVVLRLIAEVQKQQLDGTRRVPLPSRGRREVVADVHLAGLQPVPFDVVVDPSHQLVSGPDAGNRVRDLRSGPEPSEELVVSALDEQLRIPRPWQPQRDHPVGQDLQLRTQG